MFLEGASAQHGHIQTGVKFDFIKSEMASLERARRQLPGVGGVRPRGTLDAIA
jgi:hypothetical protein